MIRETRENVVPGGRHRDTHKTRKKFIVNVTVHEGEVAPESLHLRDVRENVLPVNVTSSDEIRDRERPISGGLARK
jgi:hypothetical protein